MLIGYMRVSKSDGSQILDLQKDELLKAGVLSEQIYQDFDSGKNDDRNGLTVCLKEFPIAPYCIVLLYNLTVRFRFES